MKRCLKTLDNLLIELLIYIFITNENFRGHLFAKSVIPHRKRVS